MFGAKRTAQKNSIKQKNKGLKFNNFSFVFTKKLYHNFILFQIFFKKNNQIGTKTNL